MPLFSMKSRVLTGRLPALLHTSHSRLSAGLKKGGLLEARKSCGVELQPLNSIISRARFGLDEVDCRRKVEWAGTSTVYQSCSNHPLIFRPVCEPESTGGLSHSELGSKGSPASRSQGLNCAVTESEYCRQKPACSA